MTSEGSTYKKDFPIILILVIGENNNGNINI